MMRDDVTEAYHDNSGTQVSTNFTKPYVQSVTGHEWLPLITSEKAYGACVFTKNPPIYTKKKCYVRLIFFRTYLLWSSLNILR